jgi:hypothetical protein
MKRLALALLAAAALVIPSTASARTTLSYTAAYNLATTLSEQWADHVVWAYWYDEPSNCQRAGFNEIDCTIGVENESQTFACERGVSIFSRLFTRRLYYRLEAPSCFYEQPG